MSRIVQAGHTFVAHGTLEVGNMLTASAGSGSQPGGFIEVLGTATNQGSVLLISGILAGQAGATALIGLDGVLLNEGSIVLASGTQPYSVGSGGADASGAGASAIDAGTLDNAGTLQIGTTHVNSGGAPISLAAATLAIAGTGTIDNTDLLAVVGAVALYAYSTNPGPLPGSTLSDAGLLINSGILRLYGGSASYGSHDGGAAMAVTGTLVNHQYLDIGGGGAGVGYAFGPGYGATLTNSGTLTNDGSIQLDGADATYYRGTNGASGGLLNNVGVMTNTGAINIAGSVSEYASQYQPPGATLIAAGQLTNGGLITVGGGSSYYNSGYSGFGGVLAVTGGLDNTGTIIAAGAAFSNLLRSGTGATVSVSGSLTNSGLMQFEAGTGQNAADPGAYGGNGAQLVVSGVLSNTGTLVLQITTGPGYRSGLGATATVSGSLDNSGAIVIGLHSGYDTTRSTYGDALLTITTSGKMIDSSPAASVIVGVDGVLANSGVLTNDGTIALYGVDYYGNAGSLVDTGTLDNIGLITVGYGGFDHYRDFDPAGAHLSVIGVLNNAGSLNVEGGGPGRESYEGGFGGTLTDSGNVTNTGSITVGGETYNVSRYKGAGALLNVTGVLTNKAEITVQASVYGGYGGRLVDAGVVTNDGVISIEGREFVAYYNGSFSITAGGTLTNNGTLEGSGVLINAGIIDAGAGGVTTGDITVTSLVNDGHVEVATTGALTISSAVTAGAGAFGSFDIAAQSTLTLGDMVAASQMVSFGGGQATLALGSAIAFAGTLDSLAAHDTIDFLKLDVISASTSGTILMIGLAGGTSFDLALDAPLTGVVFDLTSDSMGGTDLTLQSAPAGVPPVTADTAHPPFYAGSTALGAGYVELGGMLHLFS